MSANVPIIRRKPEGQAEFLLSLTVSHPDATTPPVIDCNWDYEWVAEHNLPPAFVHQTFLAVLQVLFAAALVAAGNVTIVPPTVEQPKPN